jgi:hypothetical protein
VTYASAQLHAALVRTLRNTGKAQLTATYSVHECRGEFYVVDTLGEKYPLIACDAREAVAESYLKVYGNDK